MLPEGHEKIPSLLNYLGYKAVQCHLKALEVTPEGHKDLPSYINNLGNAYRIRFKKLGCREDLERSIECGHEVLAIAPEDDRHRSYWMNNLGNSYILRFKRYNQMDNLDKAIAYHETAVKSASQGDPNLPVLYNSLGVSRKQRFNRLSDPGDLDKAIEHQTQGLLLTNDGHPLLPDWSMNLGASLITRFKRVGQATDADMAIKYLSQAVSLTPEFNPELPNRLNSLAVGYLALSKHQHAKSKSAQCPVGDSMVRFRSSLNWARAADEFGMGKRKLVSLGATVAQRYLDVEEIGRAPMEAAAAAIDAQEYEMALEWLELGRSVVWGQVLQLQQPLDSLSATHPELADELRRVAQSLNKSSIDPQNGSVDAVEPSNTHSNEMAAQMYRRFLMSKRISSLICACRDGPVVFVNIHSSRCDALALIPGTADVVLVPLPTFSYFQSKTIGSLGARNRGFRRPFSDDLPSQDTFELVLAELWIHVAKPVLSALGCLQPIKGSNLPHVTWCTTGAMSFLPLHAAGLYGCRQEKVSDYVISSYAPSISALLYQRPTPKTRPRVLLIGQGATPGQSPLPGAKKELDALSSLIPDYSILDDRKATTTNVLKAMESNEWVHLACHAHQCVSDPLQSGFFLHDGTLNLAMIIGRHFGNKGLAFLSACQTASGDEVIPDESVHLASGLLAAGYPSVIATMWSVHDQDAPMVAASVYRTLLKDWNMDHRKSAHALHRAVIELRANIGEKEFSRWVPYVHFGA
ncbi:CHAT domain-containing protein [Rhizoctonia solani]|nr:CHAT domain-containing protein [Rhizoctonia solani]